MQKNNKSPFSEFAIVSLTLGILAFIQLGGLEKAITAIVFGVLSLRRIAAPDSHSRGEGLAAAGIVLGAIYAIIAGVALVAIIRNPQLVEQLLKRPVR